MPCRARKKLMARANPCLIMLISCVSRSASSHLGFNRLKVEDRLTAEDRALELTRPAALNASPPPLGRRFSSASARSPSVRHGGVASSRRPAAGLVLRLRLRLLAAAAASARRALQPRLLRTLPPFLASLLSPAAAARLGRPSRSSTAAAAAAAARPRVAQQPPSRRTLLESPEPTPSSSRTVPATAAARQVPSSSSRG